MLRWHMRDAAPVVQINERVRDAGLLNPVLEGPVGVYVAPRDNKRAAAWNVTGAALQTVGQANLAWRGCVYDIYVFQKVTGWSPDFAPATGSPLYEARPN